MEMKDVRSAYACYRAHYLTLVKRQTLVRQPVCSGAIECYLSYLIEIHIRVGSELMLLSARSIDLSIRNNTTEIINYKRVKHTPTSACLGQCADVIPSICDRTNYICLFITHANVTYTPSVLRPQLEQLISWFNCTSRVHR